MADARYEEERLVARAAKRTVMRISGFDLESRMSKRRWIIWVPAALAVYHIVLISTAQMTSYTQYASKLPPWYFSIGEFPVLFPVLLLMLPAVRLSQFLGAPASGGTESVVIFWILPLLIWASYGALIGLAIDRKLLKRREAIARTENSVACPSCGTVQEIDPGSAHCDQCGSKLTNA